MKKIKYIWIFVFTVIFCISCSAKKGEENIQVKLEEDELLEQKEKSVDICENISSAWIAYWDMEQGLKALEQYSLQLDSLCVFAAYFNAEETLFIPETIKEKLPVLLESEEREQRINYLTFVNDIEYEEKSSLKDIDILRKIFYSSSETKAHIEEIVNLTKEYGFDGIDLDYEGVWKDDNLWEGYLKFIKKLYKAAKREELSVRIVLEPSALEKKNIIPKGPDYVIMCYNLYGEHSLEAGPKANKKFLKCIVKNMKKVPGTHIYALANGGYDWTKEKVSSLIIGEAVSFIETNQFQTKTDSKSKSKYCNYIDTDGIEHTIWYGDSETIAYWQEIIKKEDNTAEFILWRLN